MNLVSVCRIMALICEGLLGLAVTYLLALTVAAALAPRRTPPRPGQPDHRFLVLVPAHNEEKLLPDLLTSLQALEYPPALYEVHVVADNCTDHTANLARQAGAVVHERHDDALRGKGYALQWLVERLAPAVDGRDAAVILDADSVVSADFLRVMDTRLLRGERAIQGYYAVRSPDRSWPVGLRYAALAAIHYLRPLGRSLLGGSAGLKGNGMVLAWDLVRRFHWSAALTEDIEFHLGLLLAGERVTFAPDAIVWAEMPVSLAGAQSQNVRWERGRLEMVRRYVPRLLQQAWRRRSFALFDAAVEQIMPPFSILVAATVLALAAALLLGSRVGAVLGAALLLGEAAYILTGLILARAPWRVYLALLLAPVFVVWKVWLYLRVLLGRDRQGWLRTARNT